MSFGKWLAEKRKEARITQALLAERAGVSFSYISSIEREEPVGKYGKPRHPTVEIVDRIAKALGVDKDEARIAAEYLPEQPLQQKPPQTVQELLARLNELGVDSPLFQGGLENLPDDPDVLEDILKVISMTVEIELRKSQNAPPPPRRPLLHK